LNEEKGKNREGRKEEHEKGKAERSRVAGLLFTLYIACLKITSTT